MTSCVVSLFFLAFLCSSINAVDPTGLKLRITNRALNILTDVGLDVLQTLVNRPFADFTVVYRRIQCIIKKLTLTRLNPDQVGLSFQQGSGLQFEFRNLTFAGDLEREVNLRLWREFHLDAGSIAFGGAGVSATIGVKLSRNQQGRLSIEIPNCVFTADVILTQSTGWIGLDAGSIAFGGAGVSATIGVKLSRNQQGRLSIEIPNCVFTADVILTQSTGWIGHLVDVLRPVLRNLFNTQLCPAVQRYAVPQVNSMLENISMAMTLYKDLNIDYSLSGDVTVASTFLDVPFKGLVFRQGETVDAGSIRRGADPVFRESDRMAYVGVSEFLINSAIMSVYSTGVMAQTEMVTDAGLKAALRALQLSRQPLRMTDPLSAEVEVTEAPSITTSHRDGVTITARARVRVFAVPAGREQEQLLSVSASCTVQIMVAIKGNYLTLPSSNVDCTIITKNSIRDNLVKPLNGLLSKKLKGFLRGYFDKGVLMPLPEGMGFSQGQIDYQDGFMVLGGDLNFTPDVRKKAVLDFGR
ncbi:phospholipid transfer protein-like [Micropterus dolomieu]|uniref:phospholipid transfer protein-like n=1 Tax=Micropterus dolomieu TaxID=147949 RepID=UPI001E8E241F|nr:phospholipid transfer protein-like [Micropterus dolomieu]